MNTFTFNISLSILNHLGRNLYRSFITVLGEAISNSWDADAEHVYINIDRKNNTLIIKDDGQGMTGEDFQNKFLKIGYSKRKSNATHTEKKKRPYIGRKGIGKLALLSCAKRITVITKTDTTALVAGTIDNSGLDKAIKDDLSPNEYKLGVPSEEVVEKYSQNLEHGTIIIFEEVNEGIRNRIEYLRKLIALYFRFSLLDDSFHIYLNDQEITIKELNDLANKTQFLWIINESSDPYVTQMLAESSELKRQSIIRFKAYAVSGFIASAKTPSALKIKDTDEKVSIDLFVNGRLREKDILKHIPTTRIVESYLYGQIHFDELDDSNDRFTSSRESVVSDDPKFNDFLKSLEPLLRNILNEWDKWRVEINQEGDSENTTSMTRRERKSRELYGAVIDDFKPKKTSSKEQSRVDIWLRELATDASFNFASYAECFVAENLLRNYIEEKSIAIPTKIANQISKWEENAEKYKEKANINFEIRAKNTKLSYCAMENLAEVIDPEKDKIAISSNFHRDATNYKPVRDALAHTALLTENAKKQLNLTFENIKARVKKLMSEV